MTSTTATNPYLEDNFAPIQSEISTDELTVIGEIPPELSGSYLRNGPNPQFTPIGQYHWFDGDGMLHEVEIKHQKAKYRNRYIRTQGFLKEKEAGHAIWSGLVEPPQADIPEDQPFKNVANTALIYHANHVLALWEGGAPYEIDIPNLDTLGKFTFGDKLSSAVTAHPKIDPETGEMLFFGYSPVQPPFLTYSIVSPSGELLRTIPIDLPQPVMMHDFAITKDYTIFLDLPLTFSMERMQRGEPMIAFEADRPSRFGILPRHGESDKICWFEASPCFVFHTLNAYQERDEVVLLACRMESVDLFGTEDTGGEAGSNAAFLYEWRFNLKTGTVSEKQLDNHPIDFPSINPSKTGRKMRYGYAGKIANNPLPLFEGILKYDFETGTPQFHDYGQNRYGGEPVFVPHPQGSEEDEGWLLSYLHDENTNQSEMVIINAQDVTAQPLARILIPQRVPYGFHGIWVRS